MAEINSIHIGKIIGRELEENGMTKSEFARRLKTSPQNIQGILKRKSCDTNLLYRISRILDRNLFENYQPTKK